ncbi:hypothetical protein BDV19DRAFT_43474 [Aspergillus venezuelensis]
MFRELQETDIGLRRYPMSNSRVTGTLNGQYSVNYGLPDKFVVAVDSRSFACVCPTILRALGRMTWAGTAAVGKFVLALNEMLVLGYIEDQKMGYHDDGESSLGPTIASLSLGSEAVMTMRMEAKYYHEFTGKKNLVRDDPILPGCLNEHRRGELRQQLQRGHINKERHDELWKQKGINEAKRAPDILDIWSWDMETW